MKQICGIDNHEDFVDICGVVLKHSRVRFEIPILGHRSVRRGSITVRGFQLQIRLEQAGYTDALRTVHLHLLVLGWHDLLVLSIGLLMAVTRQQFQVDVSICLQAVFAILGGILENFEEAMKSDINYSQ
jgi:hypothetical protein